MRCHDGRKLSFVFPQILRLPEVANPASRWAGYPRSSHAMLISPSSVPRFSRTWRRYRSASPARPPRAAGQFLWPRGLFLLIAVTAGKRNYKMKLLHGWLLALYRTVLAQNVAHSTGQTFRFLFSFDLGLAATRSVDCLTTSFGSIQTFFGRVCFDPICRSSSSAARLPISCVL